MTLDRRDPMRSASRETADVKWHGRATSRVPDLAAVVAELVS